MHVLTRVKTQEDILKQINKVETTFITKQIHKNLRQSVDVESINKVYATVS